MANRLTTQRIAADKAHHDHRAEHHHSCDGDTDGADAGPDRVRGADRQVSDHHGEYHEAGHRGYRADTDMTVDLAMLAWDGAVGQAGAKPLGTP